MPRQSSSSLLLLLAFQLALHLATASLARVAVESQPLTVQHGCQGSGVVIDQLLGPAHDLVPLADLQPELLLECL